MSSIGQNGMAAPFEKIVMSGYDFSGLIFDCDGTLVNTAPLHYRALGEGFKAQDVLLDLGWYMSHLGLSKTPLLLAFEREFNVMLDHAAIGEIYDNVFPSIAHEVKEFEAVASIVRKMHGRIPMAVASGGQSRFVEAILRSCGLLNLFDTVVAFEDVSEGKPSPALFIEAARRMSTNPKRCLVFEDSEEGFEAARRAEMPFIDVRLFGARSDRKSLVMQDSCKFPQGRLRSE